MPDRDAVIEGLKKVWDAFDHMEHELYADYVFDALTLLKEQEAKEQCLKTKCIICPHCDNCDVDENGLLKEQPEIVRCKDCKRYYANGGACDQVLSNWFCADGKRQEGRLSGMSYDIRFGVKVAGAPDDCYAVIGEPEYDSPTYNLGQMFRACMGWDFKQGDWYALKDVMPNIERGIHELLFNSEKYKKYEPDNGWGTVGSALQALKSIVDYFCESNWNGLHSTWNRDVPIECIYIAW